MISSIVIVQAGRVRRAKLNYLRKLTGKASRVKRAERPELAAERKAASAAKAAE
jgi:hypothetical protein